MNKELFANYDQADYQQFAAHITDQVIVTGVHQDTYTDRNTDETTDYPTVYVTCRGDEYDISLFPLAEDQWRWSIGVWSDDITSYMHWLSTDFLESVESSPREAFEAAVAALARWVEETEEKEA
jgi:hypothetical protein